VGATTMRVISFDSVRDLPPAPPGSTFFFTEEQNGGSGWNVRLEDGSIQRIYVSIPEDRVRSFLAFTDPPSDHLGRHCMTLHYGMCASYTCSISSVW
jgi:hypothetical protein